MTYTIEETNLRRQELLADYLNPLTLHTLETISLPRGATILDAGCGLGETSLLLSARFPGTTITGIDQNAGLIEAAHSTKACKNPTLIFLTADVLHLPFADNHFDFVFTRYLLHHIPDPQAALKELVRVCKPGGLVLAQEPDANFLGSYPESWAYPTAIKIVNALFADAHLGRKLIHYFKTEKLASIHHRAEAAMAGPGSTLKQFYTMTAIALKEAILKKALMTEGRHTEWIAELTRLENDPEAVILVHPSISVWGIKRKTNAA